MDARETAQAIDDAAARWVVARDAAPRDAALAARIERWAAADPRRRGALLRAEAAWSAVDGGERAEIVPARRRLMLGGAAAAAVALTSGLGLWAWSRRDGDYATATGERRSVRLADGSTMLLNTRTRSRVALGQTRRSVTLEEGEAWFAVARDPARPFVVAAGEVRVEAVGTAFAVRRDADRVEVIVTHGRVRAWSEAEASRFAMVAAGERAVLSQRAGPQAVAPTPGGADALAWRQGEIVLDGMTLGDAAAEFNRYNARQLAVEAPLADRRIVGRFDTRDVEGFARAAATVSGGRIETGEGMIRIAE